MKLQWKNIRYLKPAISSLVVIAAANATAHHSFAIYDIDNKISRTGILTSIEFVRPHILFELEAVREDGSVEIWEIESMNPTRFDSTGKDREFVQVGDEVTILGWPARDGTDEMNLSTIIREDGNAMVVVNEVRQQRAQEDIPEVTVKRD